MQSLSRRIRALGAWLAVGISLCPAGPSRAQEAPAFGPGVALGTVLATVVNEASGLAASRRNPGVVWVHNDGAPRLYAVSTNAQLLATWRVTNAGDGDYEDVAIGPGPDPRISYLYFGDIGNNNLTLEEFRLFRIPEPAAYSYNSSNPPSRALPSFTTLQFRYPDFAREAEALMVDPRNGDVFIVTKARGQAEVFRATQAQLNAGGVATLELVATTAFDQAAGADISPAGDLIALRQEDYAQLWTRSENQTVGEALMGNPWFLPVIGRPTEPNGEALGFAADGSGYFTISEGLDPVLYFFPRESPPADPWHLLISPGTTWRYLDTGANAGTAWRAADFDDSGWKLGPAQLGYGDDDQATTINFGSSGNKRTTTYFRAEFDLTNTTTVAELGTRLVFDDGVAVYLNGTEVVRANLAADAGFSVRAAASNSDLENIWLEYALPTAVLREGRNVIAVEVHRFDPGEGDLSFDLQLLARIVPAVNLAAALLVGGDTLRLSVSGASGSTAVVEGATDFGTWTEAGQVSLTNGAGSLDVPLGAAPSFRFFRVRP